MMSYITYRNPNKPKCHFPCIMGEDPGGLLTIEDMMDLAAGLREMKGKKKRKQKVHVKESLKDDAYLEFRRINNARAKTCRMKKKLEALGFKFPTKRGLTLKEHKAYQCDLLELIELSKQYANLQTQVKCLLKKKKF